MTVVRVKIRRAHGTDTDVREVPFSELEPSEHGITMKRVFVPWHRIEEYGWEVRRPPDAEVGSSRSRASVRVVIDDGSREGATYSLPSDRFEIGPWSVSFLLDRRIEPDEGVLVSDRLVFPWHRVLEYERIIHGDDAGLIASTGATSTTPSRPDH